VVEPIGDDGTNMQSQNLCDMKNRLNSVGWFVPPYFSSGLLDTLSFTIARRNRDFTQGDLERVLARVYNPERLASMVLNRYPQVPVIRLFTHTIAEATMAHFFGLHHVAIAGLIPVIEGAGRRLAKERGLNGNRNIKIQKVFEDLADDAKRDVIARRIGVTEEIVNMLDSFHCFIADYFFSDSQGYPLRDGTNRQGILHGRYTDAEYGRPINFYKTIAAVDFLTFISSLRISKMSGFIPDHTAESKALAARYAAAALEKAE
jgi:hypothetical protein